MHINILPNRRADLEVCKGLNAEIPHANLQLKMYGINFTEKLYLMFCI